MKKILTLSLITLFTCYTFGQKKEKIRGSKSVTIESRITSDFHNIDIEDNIEVFLVKAENTNIEIETDENLHPFIKSDVNGNTLRLYTTRDITAAKKLNVTIKFNDIIKVVSARNSAIINAIEKLNVENITIKNSDFSKSYLNIKATNFTLIATDKSKIELNLKSSNQAKIEINRNAQIKALIYAPLLNIDMQQKSIAKIEGEIDKFKLRLDNNANFTGKNLTANTIQLTTEASSICNLFVVNTIEIEASGKSQTQIFGTPKINIKQFADNAVLYKKEQ